MTIETYGHNPGFIQQPKRKLPNSILRELSAFIESESTDREARAQDVADTFNMTLLEVLRQVEEFRDK